MTISGGERRGPAGAAEARSEMGRRKSTIRAAFVLFDVFY
jgi:hypothetical protein